MHIIIHVKLRTQAFDLYIGGIAIKNEKNVRGIESLGTHDSTNPLYNDIKLF